MTPLRGGKAVVSALTDVTELVLALEERTRLASIVEATSDLIGSFGLDGSCSWLNVSAERTLGLVAREFDLYAALGRSAEMFRRDVVPAVLESGRWTGDLVMRITPATAETPPSDIHLATNVIADRDADGVPIGFTIVGHDVTEQRSLQATLAHKATHDTLTGLPNRSLLSERMAEQIRAGTGLTVLFVDLDGFKQLNDTFGHEFGDDALIDVAHRIRDAVRDGGFAARFGGDEFVVLPDPTWINPLAELQKRVFDEPFTVGPIILDITGRIGMATAAPGETGMDLIARADREMYRAKSARRSTD
jgi:diguanylate cyclase (GGDEF)-like protein